jgi:hypothetical protein
VKADKVAVARLIQRLGIETLPAKVFSPDHLPTAAQLCTLFGSDVPLVLRAADPGESRNLPRVAGLRSAAAEEWIKSLPAGVAVLVQPYDEVLFSVELAIYRELYVAEVIPGIWELDSRAIPAILTIRPDDDTVARTWPLDPQPSKFHSLAGGYRTVLRGTQDWQLAVSVAWLRDHRKALHEIRELYGRPCCLKLHYSEKYGLSPQNVRTQIPDIPPSNADDLQDCVIVDHLEQEIPEGRPLLLDVAIAREQHARLVEFIGRLAASHVEVVWVKSGLLSHFAITLREAGLQVRQVNGPLLHS